MPRTKTPRAAKSKAKEGLQPGVPLPAESRTGSALKPTATVSDLSASLQRLQRQRAIVLKSRNMQANRLQALVAGTLGYSNTMVEKDRRKKFKEAAALIKQVQLGEAETELSQVIHTTLVGIEAFNLMKEVLEKDMLAVVKQLPILPWVQHPDQRGFGPLFLAIVIGETGDLASYANPAKVWRRMGCAPWTFTGGDGEPLTRMGATWRAGKEGKLPSEQWSLFGYSPRRRSIAYLIGEGIVKLNFKKPGVGECSAANGSAVVHPDGNGGRGCENDFDVTVPLDAAGESDRETDNEAVSTSGEAGPPIVTEKQAGPPGPYRLRYLTTKERARETHPDWPDLRRHLHGMLLATKMLLKNLWLEWNEHPPGGWEQDNNGRKIS